MQKIIVVAGVHGDERHALSVGKQILAKYNHIPVLIAHPQAIKARKRYLETDLNRSFNVLLPVSLEEKLAVQIRQELENLQPTIVLDIHNTYGDNTTCAITTREPSAEVLAITTHLGFTRLVIMPPSGSLIATFNQTNVTAISLEVAQNDAGNFRANELAAKIADLQINKESQHNQISVYKLYGNVKRKTLTRVGIDVNDIKNFRQLTSQQIAKLELNTDLKLYPIFAGGKHMREDAFTLVAQYN